MTPAPGSRNKDGGLAGGLTCGSKWGGELVGPLKALLVSPDIRVHLTLMLGLTPQMVFCFPSPSPGPPQVLFCLFILTRGYFLHCSSERVERGGETGRGERNIDVRRDTLIGCFPNAPTTDPCRPGHRCFLFLQFRSLLSSLGKNVLEF